MENIFIEVSTDRQQNNLEIREKDEVIVSRSANKHADMDQSLVIQDYRRGLQAIKDLSNDKCYVFPTNTDFLTAVKILRETKKQPTRFDVPVYISKMASSEPIPDQLMSAAVGQNIAEFCSGIDTFWLMDTPGADTYSVKRRDPGHSRIQEDKIVILVIQDYRRGLQAIKDLSNDKCYVFPTNTDFLTAVKILRETKKQPTRFDVPVYISKTASSEPIPDQLMSAAVGQNIAEFCSGIDTFWLMDTPGADTYSVKRRDPGHSRIQEDKIVILVIQDYRRGLQAIKDLSNDKCYVFPTNTDFLTAVKILRETKKQPTRFDVPVYISKTASSEPIPDQLMSAAVGQNIAEFCSGIDTFWLMDTPGADTYSVKRRDPGHSRIQEDKIVILVIQDYRRGLQAIKDLSNDKCYVFPTNTDFLTAVKILRETKKQPTRFDVPVYISKTASSEPIPDQLMSAAVGQNIAEFCSGIDTFWLMDTPGADTYSVKRRDPGHSRIQEDKIVILVIQDYRRGLQAIKDLSNDKCYVFPTNTDFLTAVKILRETKKQPTRFDVPVYISKMASSEPIPDQLMSAAVGQNIAEFCSGIDTFWLMDTPGADTYSVKRRDASGAGDVVIMINSL